MSALAQTSKLVATFAKTLFNMFIPKPFVRLIKWFYDTFMNPLPDEFKEPNKIIDEVEAESDAQ